MSGRSGVRPPGPTGRRIIGNSYDYDRDRIGFLKRCQAEYGDVFSFSPSTVFVSDPKLINELFRESNGTFLLEDALFASRRDQRRLVDGIDGWMRARGPVWRAMTKPVVRSHGRRIVATFDRTLRSLSGQEIDVVAVMRQYTTRLVADFCFGSDSDEIAEVSERRSALISTFMNSNLSVPRWLPLPSVRRALSAEERTKDWVAARIRHRRAQPREAAEDLLDLVLADRDGGPTDDELMRLLSATMLASAGSPGTAMTWLIVELARHPEAQRRLREEAAAATAKAGWPGDDSQLPYSQAFVKEVLRLYPPTWLMGRVVNRQCVLGGWPLAAGTRVMFSPYLVHRDPRWWPDPDALRPGRWETSAETRSPHTFIPFGAGPRVCFGMHLGMYQMVTAAAHLAMNYTLDLVAMEDVATSPGALLVPRVCRARITPLDATAGAVPGSSSGARQPAGSHVE
jgi:unspecific monooxygenase